MPVAPNAIQLDMSFVFAPHRPMHHDDIFTMMINTELQLCDAKKPFGFSRYHEYMCEEHLMGSVRFWHESRLNTTHNYMVRPIGADHFHTHMLYSEILVIPTWNVCTDPDFISPINQPSADRLTLNDAIGTIEKHFYEVMAG
jgi:hypothetical protein